MAAGKRRAPGPASTTRPEPGERRGFLRRRASTGEEPVTPADQPVAHPWRRRFFKVFKWSAITGFVLLLIAVAGFVYLYKTIDIPDPNEDFTTNASYVYYDDGRTELGSYAIQNRESIPLSEMPDFVKDAVVAAEDRSFYSNNGIDPKGILRAAFSNASGGSTQGASTITQQYVKVLYLSQERSYQRKVKEAILSLKVQREYSKEQVLEGYLNTIYFGRGAYGVQAAAKAYFDKPAAELTLRESAMLASVLNDPNDLDPADGREAKEALRERYDYVVAGMEDMGTVSSEKAEKASRRLPYLPEIESESTYGGQRGHVLALVKDELLDLRDDDGDPLFSEDAIDGGGLRVTTTLDEQVMAAAEAGVGEAKPTGFPGARELHVASATVEPGTGALRGFYAGQDYLDSEINWAIAGGQAGSTFKPFAVAAALKSGFSLRDDFDGNSPFEVNDVEFENQGDSDYGTVSLLQATEDSINTAFIDLTGQMADGPEKIIETAEAMGIPPEEARRGNWGIPNFTDGLEPITGVALGSQTVSPINMANGYATIAAEGVAADPYVIEKVTDADGEVLYEHKVVSERAISKDIAADVSYAMQQVVQAGSGTEALNLGRPVAGKTGTATKTGGAVSSSWFSGFTPQLATAVMYVRGTGNGQLDGDWLPTSSDGKLGYFGGNYPAKTWTAIMQRALEGTDPEELADPVYVDGDAGTQAPEPAPVPVQTSRPSQPAPPSQTETNTGPTIGPSTDPTSEPTSEPPTSEPTSQPPTSPPTSEPSEPEPTVPTISVPPTPTGSPSPSPSPSTSPSPRSDPPPPGG